MAKIQTARARRRRRLQRLILTFLKEQEDEVNASEVMKWLEFEATGKAVHNSTDTVAIGIFLSPFIKAGYIVKDSKRTNGFYDTTYLWVGDENDWDTAWDLCSED